MEIAMLWPLFLIIFVVVGYCGYEVYKLIKEDFEFISKIEYDKDRKN